MAKSAMRIHRSAPAVRRSFLDVCEGVVAFRLQDEEPFPRGVKLDDEVRLVIMHLAIVEVGNGKTETGILDEGTHAFMGINIIGGCLFPSCVCPPRCN